MSNKVKSTNEENKIISFGNKPKKILYILRKLDNSFENYLTEDQENPSAQKETIYDQPMFQVILNDAQDKISVFYTKYF